MERFSTNQPVSEVGVYHMGKRITYTPRTQFQAWLNEAVERKGISLKVLAEKAEADYTHVWKIARGNPEKYTTSKRPGYELTEIIGEILGDKEGAIRAAGYRKDGHSLGIDDYVPAQEKTEGGKSPIEILPSGRRFIALGSDGKPMPLSEKTKQRIDLELSFDENGK